MSYIETPTKQEAY